MKSSNRGFEAYVCVQDHPVKEVTHQDSVFIEGRKGTDYTLHFKNNEHKRVLVIPSVDGLSTLDGKPAGSNSGGYIVEGHDSLDILGWTVDNHTAAKFTFWPQDARNETTYVEALKNAGAKVDVGNQGMIGFLVVEEYFTPTLKLDGYISTNDAKIWNTAGFDVTGYTDPYRGVPCSCLSDLPIEMHTSSNSVTSSSTRSLNLGSDQNMGTKFGESVEYNTKLSMFARGRVIGEFVFEYDTLRGLKDRGVPIQKFKNYRDYGMRSAFPADTIVGCRPPIGWKL